MFQKLILILVISQKVTNNHGSITAKCFFCSPPSRSQTKIWNRFEKHKPFLDRKEERFPIKTQLHDGLLFPVDKKGILIMSADDLPPYVENLSDIPKGLTNMIMMPFPTKPSPVVKRNFNIKRIENTKDMSRYRNNVKILPSVQTNIISSIKPTPLNRVTRPSTIEVIRSIEIEYQPTTPSFVRHENVGSFSNHVSKYQQYPQSPIQINETVHLSPMSEKVETSLQKVLAQFNKEQNNTEGGGSNTSLPSSVEPSISSHKEDNQLLLDYLLNNIKNGDIPVLVETDEYDGESFNVELKDNSLFTR